MIWQGLQWDTSNQGCQECLIKLDCRLSGPEACSLLPKVVQPQRWPCYCDRNTLTLLVYGLGLQYLELALSLSFLLVQCLCDDMYDFRS